MAVTVARMPYSARCVRRALALAALALVAGTPAALAAPEAVQAARERVAALDQELAALDQELGAAAAAHNRALDRRDALLARLRSTKAQEADAERTLTESRELLADRLVDLYVNEPPDPIEVILTTRSISDALVLGTALERAAESDSQAVVNVRARRDRLEELRRRLTETSREAERELVAAEEEQDRLDALLASRRDALEAAKDQLGEALAEERARQAAIAAQQRAAREAARQAAASSAVEASVSGAAGPTSLPGGSHVFPIAGASQFSDDWLAPRPGGRYHEGIDLFAARGTPVIAVADGTLFRVGYSGISGNRLWLEDGAGTQFFYAHLDGYSSAAAEGASVSKGTVLGYVGDTGDARGTSPHVHFEIHPGGGGPVRPFPIVSAWPRAS